MAKYTNIFKRYEKKYLVTREQYEKLIGMLSEFIVPDAFGQSTINNIYFDTPEHILIRRSIEKPTVYKEKLRIRSYGHPTNDTNVFVELKKKYKGVVYKRRVNMTYLEATNYLCHHTPPPKESQVTKEIDYFVDFYNGIQPAASIFYDRIAYYSKDDHDLRLTFDTNIRFRNKDFDISHGDYGYTLLGPNELILEIKSGLAMPMWLTSALDELKIYPTTYSKYGNAYKFMLKNNNLSNSAQ